MASTNSVKILETCKVALAANRSPQSATKSSLPFTFYDIKWLKFPPTENLFFYKLTDSTSAIFNSTIFPTLKHSLSQTLLHFLPLAGHLTWPPNSLIPTIVYSPNNGVSLTLAESNTDFDDYISKL